MTPDGVQWRVGRRWMTRRPPRLRPQTSTPTDSRQSLGPGWPALSGLDFSGLDLGQELLGVAAVFAVVLVLIPILFFGFELIVLGALLAAGLLARTLLGQPWVVEATSIDPFSSGRCLEWRVRGWRRSQKFIGEVAAALAAGNEPPE